MKKSLYKIFVPPNTIMDKKFTKINKILYQVLVFNITWECEILQTYLSDSIYFTQQNSYSA